MKIVLPVHHFPPRNSAGAELYTFRLARWLLSHGHTAEVICVEQIDDTSAEGLRATHDTYEDVPVWRLALNASCSPDPFRWSYDHPLIGRWFAAYLEQSRPTLVHLQSGYLITASVLEAARDLNIPSVLTLHDFWFLCPRITLLRGDGCVCDPIPVDPAGCAWCMRLDSRRYRLPDKLTGGLLGKTAQGIALHDDRQAVAQRRFHLQQALGWPAAVVAPSHFLAGMFADMIDDQRLHVLRYGLDSTRLSQTPTPFDDGTLRLGYLGQIAAHKGVHLLVQALQMLPAHGRPVILTIYGDLEQHRTYSEQLQRQAKSDARIRFAGRFDNSRITAVLGEFDVTVTPSIWFENSPLAIMEAHAAGRPVITSALGGMAELVRHDIDGLHFRPNDAADLGRQIQRLREEPTLLSRLRQGTTMPASIDDEMQTLLGIYQQAVERPIADEVVS